MGTSLELTWCTVFSHSLQSIGFVEDVSEEHGSFVTIRRIPARLFETVESTASQFAVDGVEDAGKMIVVDDVLVPAIDGIGSDSVRAGSRRATFATEIFSRSAVAPSRSTHIRIRAIFRAVADTNGHKNDQTSVDREHCRD